ncbi:MAG: hypothetical protein WBV94_29615 [Blastocatellia bacterium]
MAEVKHGGCALCGSKQDEFLTSLRDKKNPLASIAVCSDCHRKESV